MHHIWEDFLKIIREEAGSQVVETWFKAAYFEQWNPEEKLVTLRLPNQFVSSWIQEHYIPLLRTHLGRLLHTNALKFQFNCNRPGILQEEPLHPEPQDGSRTIIPASVLTTENKHDTLQQKQTTQQPQKSQALQTIRQGTALETTSKTKPKKIGGHINEAYLFDSFAVGPSNSLAHAAAYAVCQSLGKTYNPLFIYGGTGLGKTHLLHAIANESRQRNPSVVVHYETADSFMTEFINSIRFDKNHAFREKYQKIDLLLVDDIQFFSNKEQTQETFFHIFNILYEQQKQIVLSSDTFPKEIVGLQNRLKSRLEWGLVVDIQIPDIETKIAILRKKADQHTLRLPDDVADFIASRSMSNIRELEGALVRVGAFSALTNQPITLELAKRILLHLSDRKKEGVMLNNVLKVIVDHYDISVSCLKSKKRHKDISVVRQVAFYMMKKLTFCSLQAIGEFLGGRDHSTVIHAITKVENLLTTDPAFAQKLRALEQEILSN